VRAVARSYVDAGSEIILTNTFRANPVTLAGHEMAGRVAEVNRAGVRISREAAEGRARVFASLGPTGKLLISGEISAGEVREAFRVQAHALAAAGPDALLFETFSDLDELLLAIDEAHSTGLPILASFVFDTGKNKDRTMTGVTPESAARAAEEAGADAVGANCGQGVSGFVAMCQRLKSATSLPVWIKANAGLPVLEGGVVSYKETPQDFAAHAPALREAGAAFLGGCCGSNPEFIRALRAAVES
jgi:methionine synthase I (cobalamin-dependent)